MPEKITIGRKRGTPLELNVPRLVTFTADELSVEQYKKKILRFRNFIISFFTAAGQKMPRCNIKHGTLSLVPGKENWYSFEVFLSEQPDGPMMKVTISPDAQVRYDMLKYISKAKTEEIPYQFPASLMETDLYNHHKKLKSKDAFLSILQPLAGHVIK